MQPARGAQTLIRLRHDPVYGHRAGRVVAGDVPSPRNFSWLYHVISNRGERSAV